MNTYWFFDSALKRDTCGAKNIPGKLIKDSCNPLFVEGINEPLEKPWEQQIGNGYPNVFYDPLVHKFRCYYTAFLAKDTNQSASIQTYNAKERRTTAILYAESENGLQWVKPSLGIVEYQSSKENNILALSTHGAGVLLDLVENDPQKRYKIISRDDRGPLNIHVAFSDDGIHFDNWTTVIDDPHFPGDTHNFALRDPVSGRYLLFTRSFSREMRVEVRLESDDFLHWTNAKQVLSGLDMDDQVYGMPVFCQDGLYWGLAEIFYAGDSSNDHYDHVEVELCYSGDGVRWNRIAPGRPFIANGAIDSYDFGCCYAASPVRDGMDYRFYYMGGNGTHYDLKHNGLCLGTIKRNRLAGVAARNEDMFTYQTRLLSFDNKRTGLCVDVTNGCIRYEALDKEGKVILGLSKDDCYPIVTSSNHAALRWQNEKAPEGACMLKFYCNNAVLYSIAGDITIHPVHPL